MEKEIAAKLYISRGQTEDLTIKLLEVLQLTKDTNIQEVIESYSSIKAGELKVAHVVTSVELDSSQQSNIESKIKSQFTSEKLVFVFEVEKDTEYGISIRVGDDAITFSTNTKLSELIAENGN